MSRRQHPPSGLSDSEYGNLSSDTGDMSCAAAEASHDILRVMWPLGLLPSGSSTPSSLLLDERLGGLHQ